MNAIRRKRNERHEDKIDNSSLLNMNSSMNRRVAISTIGKAAAGVVGVVVIGGILYYVLQGGQVTPATTTITTTPTTTATTIPTTTSATTTVVEKPISADPVVWDYWIFGVDVIKSNIEYYNQVYSENLQGIPIPGDWIAQMESRFVAKVAVDTAYAQSGNGARWMNAGWIEDLNTMPGIEDIKKEMYPKILKALTLPNGELMGLVYYTDPFILYRNEKMLEQIGEGGPTFTNASQYPQTWDEVESICLKLKQNGLSDAPYTPAWFPDIVGLPWDFICQLFGDGEFITDPKTFEATFDVNTPFRTVLERMKRWWDTGIVPKDVLSWQLSDFLKDYYSGRRAFTTWLSYEFYSYNDPTTSNIAGNVNLNPVWPGTKQNYALPSISYYVKTKRERTPGKDNRVNKVIKFLGYGDPDNPQVGKYYVPKKWNKLAMLGEAFPAMYDDPEAKADQLRRMYPPLAETAREWHLNARLNSNPNYGYHTPWWDDWAITMRDAVSSDLLIKGTKTPTQVTEDLRKAWDDLRKTYMG